MPRENQQEQALPSKPIFLTSEEREKLCFILGIPEDDLIVDESEFCKRIECPPNKFECWLDQYWHPYDIRAVLAGTEEVGAEPWLLVDERDHSVRLFSASEALLRADAEQEVAFGAQRQTPGQEPVSVSDLLDWWAHVAYSRRLCVQGCRITRAHHWHGVSSHQTSVAFACVAEIEKRISVLKSRSLLDVEAQSIEIDKCFILMCEIAAYTGETEIVKQFTEAIVHSRQKWGAFLEALIASKWLESSSPRGYLNRVATTIYHHDVRPDVGAFKPKSFVSDSQGVKHRPGPLGKVRGTEALGAFNTPYVTLEEIAERPDEALLERRFTERSVAELQQAAEVDPRLVAYVQAIIRFPKWNKEDIWKSLGLTDKEGKAVDRRYRRLRQRLKDIGAGMEWRFAPTRGMCDASQTTYFEVLRNGANGDRFGLLQHRPMKKQEK